MDIAVVGVSSCVALDGDTCTAARIGLGAVAARPLLAKEAGDSLVGKTLDDAAIDAAANSSTSSLAISDNARHGKNFVRIWLAFSRAAQRVKKPLCGRGRARLIRMTGLA